MDERLEELLFLKDFMKRYHMGEKLARRTMHSMPHHDKPLFVTASACAAWERMELQMPATPATKEYIRDERRTRAKAAAANKGKFLVPRERPGG